MRPYPRLRASTHHQQVVPWSRAPRIPSDLVKAEAVRAGVELRAHRNPTAPGLCCPGMPSGLRAQATRLWHRTMQTEGGKN